VRVGSLCGLGYACYEAWVTLAMRLGLGFVCGWSSLAGFVGGREGGGADGCRWMGFVIV